MTQPAGIDLQDQRREHRNAMARKQYARRRDHFCELSRQHRQDHPDYHKTYSAERNAKRKADPEWSERSRKYARNYHLVRKYGITADEYDALLAKQGGKCAGCRSDDPKRRTNAKTFHVDHDHVTGKVRGLLCHHCSLVLGLVDDTPDLLRVLAEYLEGASR